MSKVYVEPFNVNTLNTNPPNIYFNGLPIEVQVDETTKTVYIKSDYNIIFKSTKDIVSIADGNNIVIGTEVHLNPKLDFFKNTRKFILKSIKSIKHYITKE